MSGRAEFFLGIIALTTAATAVVQIGVLVVAGLLARRIHRMVDHIDEELKPLFGHLNAIGRDASRAASLATAQVERVDRLMTDLVERLEQILNGLQAFVSGPVRSGSAFMSAFRMIVSLVREARTGRRRPRADDEDPLFI
jgi:predicted PurR-regulated permease PerM